MNMSLQGKNSIVTGGGQGIGKAICEKLAASGSNIIIFDLNEEKSVALTKELETKYQIKSRFYKVNVASKESVDAAVETAIETFGSINILVNNAGITKDNLFFKMSEEDWNLVLSINLTGSFNCIKSVIRKMAKEKFGRIINISSIIGLIGNAGQANYAASKAGLIGLTKSIAKEFAGKNITANAITPGFIQTAMTDVLPEKIKSDLLSRIPLKRLGQPEDIANAVNFLVSDEANYITGQVLTVDGGMVG
jgi:3-oxoacyl-[acyl-carrier protein] reductase